MAPPLLDALSLEQPPSESVESRPLRCERGDLLFPIEKGWRTAFGRPSSLARCLPPCGYIAARWVLFTVWLVVSVISIADHVTAEDTIDAHYVIYLTHWTLLLECAYFGAAALVSSLAVYSELPEAKGGKTPWFARLAYALQAVTYCATFLVFVLYWALVYDGGTVRRSEIHVAMGLLCECVLIARRTPLPSDYRHHRSSARGQLHRLLCRHASVGPTHVIVARFQPPALRVQVRRPPPALPTRSQRAGRSNHLLRRRPAHLFVSLIYGLTYCAFSLIYDLSGGTSGTHNATFGGDPYVYEVLDWSETPGMVREYCSWRR